LVLVSVIIPVRNGEAFVVDAVESVLAQQDVRSELIAVDDGSTDRTPELLARFAGRIVVQSQEGRGLSAARNAGLALARGELLVFLDADDLHPPHYLARFVEAAAAAPQAEVFHCGWRGIDFDGCFLYGQETPLDLDRDPFHVLAATGSPPISALAVRRRAATRVGPFDESLTLQEDWDYWLRLAASGATFQGVPGNEAIVRRRDGSMSTSAGTRLAVSGLAILERHLSRHPRCPACVYSDAGLASWRRAVLRSSARDFARRLHLKGRTGRLIGASLAVARAPRLASAAWPALRERLRAR
jgi:glycosyltransferase involved in cell wall biosynthesis